ncbi:hypothetical protein M5E84_11515 [[Ruminococcus] torques]|nr:hypothetical protein M5E84_11515 [[Ruminococcus] torques]
MEKGNCMSVGIFCIAADGDCFGAGNSERPPIDMQLIQQLQEAKMPMQSDVSEEGQIVQSSGEQSELTENGQTDQPSGNQSGSLENGQTGQPSGNQSGSMENGQTVQQPGDQSGSAENGQAGQPSGDQSGSAENGQTDPSSDQQSKSADLYENGIIKIYNIEQLQAIGTGSSVRMNDTEKELFGTGEEVVDGGNAVTYASDADYMLMNEIPLTEKTMWTLPEGFTEHLQKLRKRMLRCMIKKAIRFMFTITISFS